MDGKPKNVPTPGKRTGQDIQIVRGNDRNMWIKPTGQRPERLNPPIYEPS